MKMPTLEQFRTSRNLLFWSLHAAGWAALRHYPVLRGAAVREARQLRARHCRIRSRRLRAVDAHALHLPAPVGAVAAKVMILGVLATCYVTALALRIVINYSYKAFVEPDWQARGLFELFGGALSTTYLLVCWSVLYFGIKFYESQRKQEEAMLKAVALAQEAQLKMLRYQLNPHFLFNTLNAISTLILDNQNRIANHAVTRLSEFLRYTLDQDPMKKVTLRQELEALDLYLGTERLRFGDRLRLEYAIEESAMDALVPSLLLQPLLENALKYAVSTREQGGRVRIEGRVRENWLELSVIDDGPGLREGPAVGARRGVGLRNTCERLAVLYIDSPSLQCRQRPPGAARGHGAAAGARRGRRRAARRGRAPSRAAAAGPTHEDPYADR